MEMSQPPEDLPLSLGFGQYLYVEKGDNLVRVDTSNRIMRMVKTLFMGYSYDINEICSRAKDGKLKMKILGLVEDKAKTEPKKLERVSQRIEKIRQGLQATPGRAETDEIKCPSAETPAPKVDTTREKKEPQNVGVEPIQVDMKTLEQAAKNLSEKTGKEWVVNQSWERGPALECRISEKVESEDARPRVSKKLDAEPQLVADAIGLDTTKIKSFQLRTIRAGVARLLYIDDFLEIQALAEGTKSEPIDTDILDAAAKYLKKSSGYEWTVDGQGLKCENAMRSYGFRESGLVQAQEEVRKNMRVKAGILSTKLKQVVSRDGRGNKRASFSIDDGFVIKELAKRGKGS